MTTIERAVIEHEGEVSQAVINATDHKDKIIKRKLRAIIYCRVSTDKQEQDGESLEYQEEKCQQYADLHDYEVFMILKEAKSGFIHYSLREKLALARQIIRDGLADVIIVFDLRRFSRNFVHSAMIFEEIEQFGGMIVSVSENIDNSLTGKLIRSILAWSAESEHHKIVEYANRHWQHRLELGLPMATGRILYGWDWGDKEKLTYVLNLEEAAVRYSILHMFVRLDMSLRAIAHKLTEDGFPTPTQARGVKVKGTAWHPSTVKILIEGEENIGNLVICKRKKSMTEKGKVKLEIHPQRKVIPGGIPAIATIDLYERALQKLKINKEPKSHPPKNKEDFLVQGHIFCKTCSYKMNGRNQKSRGEHIYPYYRCTNNQNIYMACPDQPTIRTSLIDQIVWEDCCKLFERLELTQKTIEQKIEQEINSLLEETKGKKQVLDLQQEIAIAEEERDKHPEGSYYYNLVSEDIRTKKEKLQRYQEESQTSKLIVSQAKLYKERAYGFINFLNRMRGRYHEANFQEKRDAIEILGVKVYVYPDNQEHQEMMESEKEWLSVREAAEITGLAIRTIRNAIQQGALQAQETGMPHMVVHRDVLSNFLQTTKVRAKNAIHTEQHQQEWFSAKEIAQMIGMSIGSIQAYITSGKLQARMTEGKIHRDVLKNFMVTAGVRPKNNMDNVKPRIEITYSPMFTSVQLSFGIEVENH